MRVTSNDFLDPGPSRALRAAVMAVALAGIAGLVVLGAAGWQTLTRSTTGKAAVSSSLVASTGSTDSSSSAHVLGTGSSGGSATSSTSATGSAVSARAVWSAAGIRDDLPAGGAASVILPRGTGSSGTWQVGFARTTSGAVAAAVEYVSHTACLSERCADDLTRRVFSPAWPDAQALVRASVLANRRELGIPVGARVPAGASAAVSPMAFQIDPDDTTSASGDLVAQVRVVLLCYQDLAGPGISPTNRILVVPVPLHWQAGRWVIVPGDRSYQDLGARPGTPAALAAGWRDFAA